MFKQVIGFQILNANKFRFTVKTPYSPEFNTLIKEKGGQYYAGGWNLPTSKKRESLLVIDQVFGTTFVEQYDRWDAKRVAGLMKKSTPTPKIV